MRDCVGFSQIRSHIQYNVAGFGENVLNHTTGKIKLTPSVNSYISKVLFYTLTVLLQLLKAGLTDFFFGWCDTIEWW